MSIEKIRCSWDGCLATHPKTVFYLCILRNGLLRFPMRTVEMMLAFIALVTGFWIGWPWHKMYVSNIECYNTLVNYMPPAVWTVTLTAASIPSILFIERAKWKVIMRLTGMGILLSLWVLASLLFIIDRAPYLATAWTPVFAFYQAWSMLYSWLRIDDLRT